LNQKNSTNTHLILLVLGFVLVTVSVVPSLPLWDNILWPKSRGNDFGGAGMYNLLTGIVFLLISPLAASGGIALIIFGSKTISAPAVKWTVIVLGWILTLPTFGIFFYVVFGALLSSMFGGR